MASYERGKLVLISVALLNVCRRQEEANKPEKKYSDYATQMKCIGVYSLKIIKRLKTLYNMNAMF